jgi:hypothetical protein
LSDGAVERDPQLGAVAGCLGEQQAAFDRRQCDRGQVVEVGLESQEVVVAKPL